MSEDEAVGYRRPPKHTQFQKGRSGNPKGRPKYVRNFKTVLRGELAELIVVRENGRERKLTKLEALVKSLVAAAIHGDMRATNAIVAFSTKMLGGDDDSKNPTRSDADDQDIIDAFVNRELKRNRAKPTPTPSNAKRTR